MSKGINSAIIGNCRLGNGHGRHSLEGPGRGLNPYPGAQTTTGLLVVEDPSPRTPVLFEGCLLLHISCPFTRPPSRSRVYFLGSRNEGKHFLVEVSFLCKKAIFRHLRASATTARSPPPSPQEHFLHSISNNTIMVPLNNDKNSPKLGILVRRVNRCANWKAIIINCNP